MSREHRGFDPCVRFFFYADYSGVLDETDIHWVDTGIFDQFRPPG